MALKRATLLRQMELHPSALDTLNAHQEQVNEDLQQIKVSRSIFLLELTMQRQVVCSWGFHQECFNKNWKLYLASEQVWEDEDLLAYDVGTTAKEFSELFFLLIRRYYRPIVLKGLEGQPARVDLLESRR